MSSDTLAAPTIERSSTVDLAEWQTVSLCDVADITRGTSWANENERREPVDGALPVLGIKNVQRRLETGDLLWLYGLKPSAIASSTVQTGDILMVGSNGNPARIGNAVRIDEPGRYLFASLLFGLRPRRDVVDPDFLYQAIVAPGVQTAISDAVQGTTGLSNLKITTLRDLPLNLPPLDEQRRIAEVLRSVDEAIAFNDAVARRARSTLDHFGREVLQAPDAEPADGNLRLPLLDICRPRQHPIVGKVDLLPSGYPVFGANGQIGFYHSFTHSEPVIAITCRGATCGTVNWVPAKSYVTGNAMALDDLDRGRVDERFLYHYVSLWGVDRSISGSAQPQITRQSLSCIDIIAPSLERQVDFASALDGIERDIEIAEVALAKFQETKAALMSDLLSGHVQVPA